MPDTRTVYINCDTCDWEYHPQCVGFETFIISGTEFVNLFAQNAKVKFDNCSCHHPTVATKCNVQPSQATANPVNGKACSSTKGGLLRYIVNTYSIHKVSNLKFAYYKHVPNMLLIRCTNVFFQGRLSRHNLS